MVSRHSGAVLILLSPTMAMIVGAVLGATFGSFIATWVVRAGDAKPVTGRSACDACGRTLAVIDLVPLLSWAMQRGRCRTCKGRIDPLHPATEAMAALIGGWSLWLAPDQGGAALMLLGLMLLTLALFDARYLWLPHWLSAATALAGILLGGIAMSAIGLTVPLTDRLIGCGIGFVLLWLIGVGYRVLRGRQGLGGGDAPMFAAIGAWTGWSILPVILLLAALAGIGVALARIAGAGTDADRDWRLMRLPLGTLLALATGPAIWAISMIRPGHL
jgi:leader peptidase (prepilin peptidase)/N-methyltransferase